MITKLDSIHDLAAAANRKLSALKSGTAKTAAVFDAASARYRADCDALPPHVLGEENKARWCGVEWQALGDGRVVTATLISCMGSGDFALLVNGGVRAKGTRSKVAAALKVAIFATAWGAPTAGCAAATAAKMEQYAAAK